LQSVPAETRGIPCISIRYWGFRATSMQHITSKCSRIVHGIHP
jgi:hypothetical protein